MRLISADFSGEQALYGQQLNVKIPNAFDGADDYSTSTGYDTSDVDQDEYPVTINKHKHVTYAFNDQERTSHDFHLIERFARNAAHALGKQFMDDLTGVIVASNFSNETEVPTADTFSPEQLFDIREKLNLRKLPKMGRIAVLNSGPYKAIPSAHSQHCSSRLAVLPWLAHPKTSQMIAPPDSR